MRGSGSPYVDTNRPKLAIPETLAQTDDLFKHRDDISNLTQAVQLAGRLRDADERNFEVEWKFAEYSYFLGQSQAEEADREKTFEAGKNAAGIAARLQPDRPEGYFWFASNLGELAKMSPISVGLRSVDDIREAANKVIELDPGYQGASAYDILAQIELGTRLTGGKPEKAVAFLEKSLELEKNNSNNRVDLARAYLAVDKYEQARQQLQYVIQMQPDPQYLPEHKAAVERAKTMLATKF